MKLRKATFDDWKFLLDLRNDDEARKNSHHTEEIDPEAHKQWLDIVLKNEYRQLLIAIENDEPVGSIRADFNTAFETYEISCSVMPGYRGKGIGTEMVKHFVARQDIKVIAEIKKSNIASIKMVAHAGMKLVKEENEILYYSN